MTHDDNDFNQDEDDWFFSSITRYDHLFMYDFELNAKDDEVHCISISPSGDRWALLTSKELRVYDSPTSLQPSGVKLPKRDVPLLAGVSYSQSIGKFVAFLCESQLLTDTFCWKMNETDLLQRGRELSITSPNFSNVEKSHILGLTKDALYSIDYNSDTKVLSHDSDIASALFHEKGLFLLKSNGGVWRDNGSQEYELTCSPPDQMTLLSPFHVFVATGGSSAIYENGKKLFEIGENVNSCPLLCPNRKYVSFVSRDSRIKVLALDSSGKEVFVHDGHKTNLVSHAWHPTIENTIYSVDKNKNVQIWKFKVVSS